MVGLERDCSYWEYYYEANLGDEEDIAVDTLVAVCFVVVVVAVDSEKDEWKGTRYKRKKEEMRIHEKQRVREREKWDK